MKHFEDLADAKEEKFGNPGVYSEIWFQVTDLRDPTFQKLLYLDVAANVVADVSEAGRKKKHRVTHASSRAGFHVPGESGHPSEGHSASAHGVHTRIENHKFEKINRFTGRSR